MAAISNSSLLRGYSIDEMPSFTEELSGSELQFCDRSPTATPAQTRSGSPIRVTLMPHTTEQTSRFMQDLHAIAKKDAAKKLNLAGDKTMATVGAIDGSVNIDTMTKIKFLAVYLFFNLGLTLYNKAVMFKFPFPFLLTALHAAAGSIGTALLLSGGYFNLTPITTRSRFVLLAFSVLYTANIAVSNLSLHLVTIPFHQTLRATAPIPLILIYRLLYRSTYSLPIYLSLLPLILGVALATYGDYYYTPLGFFFTLLGTVLAAIKTVTTNRLQTSGLHLGALELLYRMSPLACLQSLLIAYFNGETAAFRTFTLSPTAILIIAVNGIMAFGLNVSSFSANKKAGALTMTVAANVKQILTVLLAILFWKLQVGWINALGIAITLAGAAWYAYLELSNKKTGSDVQLEPGEVSSDDEVSNKGFRRIDPGLDHVLSRT